MPVSGVNSCAAPSVRVAAAGRPVGAAQVPVYRAEDLGNVDALTGEEHTVAHPEGLTEGPKLLCACAGPYQCEANAWMGIAQTRGHGEDVVLSILGGKSADCADQDVVGIGCSELSANAQASRSIGWLEGPAVNAIVHHHHR